MAAAPVVPIVDLRAQYHEIETEVLAAVGRVLASQRFILGPEVEGLEREVAALSGAAHAVACASGSDAILLAVASLLPPRTGAFAARKPSGGDAPEVVTVPFTFFASAGSVVHAGAVPRFVDIEPEAYGMDPALVRPAIGPRTVAVLPVHLFGHPCELGAIARSAGAVPVIEDAAQAIGAAMGAAAIGPETAEEPDSPAPGRVPDPKALRAPVPRRATAGAAGLLGCLSFFPTKNLGGAGDGGMVLTSDRTIAERLVQMRGHGGRQMYHHETVGWNSRLDEIQAAVLRVKVPRLADWSRARSERADRYDALLGEAGLVSRGLVLPPVRKPGRGHIFHQYVVRVPGNGAARERDALRAHLDGRGVATGVYYPVPLHLQPCFRDLGHGRGDFPVSERAAEEVLALPIFPELTADQQAFVVRGIAEHFGVR